MNFKPYGDKIVVKEIEEKVSRGGIVLPVTKAMEYQTKGEVVAVSDGFLHGGKEWPVTSKVGDIVFFQQGLGIPFEFEDGKYLILQEAAIWGRVKREKVFVENQDTKELTEMAGD